MMHRQILLRVRVQACLKTPQGSQLLVSLNLMCQAKVSCWVLLHWGLMEWALVWKKVLQMGWGWGWVVEG